MTAKKQPIQFTFSPDDCIGGVRVGREQYVLEVLGFVAIGSVVEVAEKLGVDSGELYDTYSKARESILPVGHPIKTTSIGDISLKHVMRLRNNLIADNFKLMQGWLEQQPSHELAHVG
jgi:hypothetical protein